MAIERMRFVLSQHNNLTKPRVDEVRNSEINEPVVTGKRNSGLCSIRSEGHQSLALAPGENNSEHFWCRHPSSVADAFPSKRAMGVE
jgi:hypothetical protein